MGGGGATRVERGRGGGEKEGGRGGEEERRREERQRRRGGEKRGRGGEEGSEIEDLRSALRKWRISEEKALLKPHATPAIAQSATSDKNQLRN